MKNKSKFSLKRAVAAVIAVVMASQLALTAFAQQPVSTDAAPVDTTGTKELRLWYDEPAPDSDNGWEQWSLPLGCGYMGANVFGRTDTERIQITENSLANPYNPGLNNFSEVYIDFNHANPSNYTRDLDIREAVAHVNYDWEGTTYTREYFTSYPDKVMAIRLSASDAGKLSFTLRPTVPFVKDYNTTPGDGMGKSGSVSAEGDTITLSGNMHYYDIDFEGQLKVIPTGGSMRANNDENGVNGTITVENADSAVILMAVGTNYQMESRVFTEPDAKKKLDGYEHPHAKVTQYIQDASQKSFDELLEAHKADYQQYFNRVNLNLGAEVPQVTTDVLLNNYKKGDTSQYLDELYFQYGRYLLIASSRKGTLPGNLQGIWNRYDQSPWSAGYWHNINIQMNYWPAFSTNLAEMFESYADYNEAFREAAQQNADQYLKQTGSKLMAEVGTGENGWAIGTGTWPYRAEAPSATGHSGPGTGAFTTKLFWDYYDFTRDEDVLRDTTYPAIEGMAKFLSKTLIEEDGKQLAYPSASPEQRQGSGYYRTTGCAFDQQMIYENHNDLIKAADILGIDSQIVDTCKEQIDKLDPVNVGYSGQVKEYREENYYGEIGEYQHRHISQLVGLQPGTLINSSTPAWMDAAKVTLNKRGDKSTGWAMAHRLNLWARTGDGNRSYTLFQNLLKNGTLTNLWDTHPPFQIDGNYGGTAGVAEMLLQSQEGVIMPLAARPDAWANGSYQGLVARGNFEVSADWANGQATKFEITSNKGGECKLSYYNIADAVVKTSDGQVVSFTKDGSDLIIFDTVEGETYTVTEIPSYTLTAKPGSLSMNWNADGSVSFQWGASADAESYSLYRAVGDAPDYELIASDINTTAYTYAADDLADIGQCTFRVTAVGANGRESDGATTLMLPATPPEKVTGYRVDESTLQLSVSPVDGAEYYTVYKKAGDGFEKIAQSPYNTIILENAAADAEYAVSAFTARESEKTPVEITTNFEIENVMLGKPISADRAVNSSYPLSNAVDGNLGTRYALTDKGGAYHVEIDLQGTYPLDQLKIYEFNPPEGQSRSDETTIEVWNNDQWNVVIDKVKMEDKAEFNNFDMGGAVGSKVRITFNNKHNAKSATIWEITCNSVLSQPANKLELYKALTEISAIDPSSYIQNEAVSALADAKKNGISLLNDLSATQQAADAAAQAIRDALANFDENAKQNLFYKKPITTNVSSINATFAKENIVDGDLTTRFAAPDNGNTVTVEIDMQKETALDKLFVLEYIGPEGTTRGNETTIEVLHDGSWNKVIDKQSLTANVPIKAETAFDLGGAVGSKVRITFNNTANNNKRITIYEISAQAVDQPVLDTAPLEEKIAEAQGIDGSRYTADSFAALQQAILSAQEVLGSATSQQQLDDAVKALQAAMDGLERIPAEDTNKTILDKVVEKAETLLDSEEFANAISSVQASFTAALDAARGVAGDEYATQEQIDAAWVALMTEIHKLGLQQGDKTLLAEHVALYSQLDLNLYLDGDAKEHFKAALEAAEAMLSNTDAVQSEVNDVDATLVAAASALVLRGDKTALQSAVDATSGYIQDNYAKGWAEFEAAREKANQVLDNENATQEEINAALDELIEAMLSLRYKADKTLLNAVVAAAQNLDLSGYSEASVAAFRAALAQAKAKAEDESLSVDEQDQVNEAADNLKAAISGLSYSDGRSANLCFNGDGSITSTTGSARTGDNTPITATTLLFLLAAAVTVTGRKRKGSTNAD